ncbi:hypothetical protein V8F20_006953 [Naviculisporaceae sp. PSN 640]
MIVMALTRCKSDLRLMTLHQVRGCTTAQRGHLEPRPCSRVIEGQNVLKATLIKSVEFRVPFLSHDASLGANDDEAFIRASNRPCAQCATTTRHTRLEQQVYSLVDLYRHSAIVTAGQSEAKLSGMFPLPGTPRRQTTDPTKLQALMSQPNKDLATSSLLGSAARSIRSAWLTQMA